MRKNKFRADGFPDGTYGMVGRVERFHRTAETLAFISNGTRDDDVMLAELCESRRIPVILISHGSHVWPKTQPEKIEWGEHGKMLLRGPFSHLALQTPLAESYLEVFPSKSAVVKTGPLIWGIPVNRREGENLLKRCLGINMNQEKQGSSSMPGHRSRARA